MKIAREQKPGVRKEKKKESYWNNFNRKVAIAAQPVILLPSHPNCVLKSLQTLFGINEAKRAHWTRCPAVTPLWKRKRSDPCSISPVLGECLWSCCCTKVTLTDMHLSNTESATAGQKDTRCWEMYPLILTVASNTASRIVRGSEQCPSGSTLEMSADFCNKPTLRTGLFTPQTDIWHYWR